MWRLVFVIVGATWLPGLIGNVFSLSPAVWWGVASGYLGLSWLVPGLLVGHTVKRMSSRRSPRLARLYAFAAGLPATLLFLLGAAAVNGS
jgi:hypothetical protein